MTTRYGFTEEEWTAAKEKMRQALIERAKLRGMIPYSELVEKITTIELEPNSFALAELDGDEIGYLVGKVAEIKRQK